MDLEPKEETQGRNVWIIHGSFGVTLVTLAKVRLHFSVAAG
jgi:cytochrome b561